MQNSIIDTPQWALEIIRTTKNQKRSILNLSLSYDDKREPLTIFPNEIFALSGLVYLNLSGNQISTLPESIGQLQDLKELNLISNRLSTLPKSIIQLQKLTYLGLSGNPLNTMPESIAQLKNLTTLEIHRDQLNAIPESISELENLTHLDLSSNQLAELPESISELEKLTYLNLSSNQLTMLPESIALLKNLEVLYLNRNQFSIFPESITQLQKLTDLDLSYNQLTKVSESLTPLYKIKNLLLENNPLISPPIEIAIQGIGAVRNYFRQLYKEGVDYLYEAKLLILGEGGAGKTTFAHKILDTNYKLKPEEVSTQGVDVYKWSFLMEGRKQFKVNIWDFGGQEIYHATHQFFLTKRSLYTLVADTRKDDTDFYYWLNVAELLSDGSPILIIKNEKGDRHREINERQLKGQFDSLKVVLATNLATNRGLPEVIEEIKPYLRKLPHIGSPLPKTWVRVREKLEKDSRNYISLEEYLAICVDNGFIQITDSLQLSGYLHDIGVFLHFQDDPLLRKTVILKPKWGTDAVYKVLDNPAVIKNLGQFRRADLKTIWNASEYKTMHDELLQLMIKFRLCYEIPTQKGTYIAPQLLTENQSDYEWDEKENLLLRYSYDFMPKGILTQFIVIMNSYIGEKRIVWKSGIVIEKDQTQAEVIEYYGKREIQVRVAGGQKRDLMTLIRDRLKQIHDAYKGLKYDELIQCNCSTCKDNQEPNFYTIAELADFRANGQREIQCRKKPYYMVNVMGLLGDVIDLGRLSERAMPPNIYVQGDLLYKGNKKMANIKQNIQNATVHGSVVAAETIQDSFNVIEKSNAKDDLKEQLRLLNEAVKALTEQLPKEKAEDVADDMKRLAEEAVTEKPNRKWYSLSIDGLIKAADNLGEVGDRVITLSKKVLSILTGGILE